MSKLQCVWVVCVTDRATNYNLSLRRVGGAFAEEGLACLGGNCSGVPDLDCSQDHLQPAGAGMP